MLDVHDLAVWPQIVRGRSIWTVARAKSAISSHAEYSTPLVEKNRPIRWTTLSATEFANANALGCRWNRGCIAHSGRTNSSTDTTRLSPEKEGQNTLLRSAPSKLPSWYSTTLLNRNSAP